MKRPGASVDFSPGVIRNFGQRLCVVENSPWNSQVSPNRADSSWSQVPTAPIGNCGFRVIGRIDPNLVVSPSLPIETTTYISQLAGDVPVSQIETITLPRMGGESAPSRMTSIRSSVSSRCISMKAGAKLASISMASSGVSPHARQPGRSGASAMYLSGSS